MQRNKYLRITYSKCNLQTRTYKCILTSNITIYLYHIPELNVNLLRTSLHPRSSFLLSLECTKANHFTNIEQNLISWHGIDSLHKYRTKLNLVAWY